MPRGSPVAGGIVSRVDCVEGAGFVVATLGSRGSGAVRGPGADGPAFAMEVVQLRHRQAAASLNNERMDGGGFWGRVCGTIWALGVAGSLGMQHQEWGNT